MSYEQNAEVFKAWDKRKPDLTDASNAALGGAVGHSLGSRVGARAAGSNLKEVRRNRAFTLGSTVGDFHKTGSGVKSMRGATKMARDLNRAVPASKMTARGGLIGATTLGTAAVVSTRHRKDRVKKALPPSAAMRGLQQQSRGSSMALRGLKQKTNGESATLRGLKQKSNPSGAFKKLQSRAGV